MSDQFKADLVAAKKRLRALEAHRQRLNGLTPDRWLEEQHWRATLEVNRLTAQVNALKVHATEYAPAMHYMRAQS